MRGMDGDVATAAAAPRRLSCPRPCLPPKPMANVTGTANIAAGYRMRRLPEPRPGPVKLATSLVGPYRPPSLHDQDQKLLLKLHSQRIHEKKITKRRIHRRVELGMEAYEEDLEARRDRLRELLLREEAALTRELIEACRRRESERVAELEGRANEEAEERERERQRLVEEKRLQLFAQSSQKLRGALAKAWTEDAKRVNLAQIQDAEERRRREQEHEAFWHNLMRRYCLEGEAAAAEEARRRAAAERDVAEALRDQMRAKSSRAADEGRESFLFGHETDEAEAARRAKALAWRDDLERQILEARRELERRREEELKLDRMSAYVFGAPAKDDRDKEARRREIFAFMDSMREFREAVARREREVEECLARLAAEADARRSEQRRRAREDRARLERELRLTWDRQLAERREAERRELELLRDNCQAEDPEAEKAERARRHQAHLEYGRELLAQQERTEARRAREERETDELYARIEAEREREERRLVHELVPRIRASADRRPCPIRTRD